MEKRIVWERYNLKEHFESAIKECQEEDEDWKENNKLPFPLINNPTMPDEYYIAHCSFRLTKLNFNILNSKIDGIESFKILSPYRFVCAIAKCFDVDIVKSNINIAFGINKKNYTGTDIDKKIEVEKNKLKEYKDWAIYLFPNGNIDSIKLEEDIDGFNKQKEDMRQLSQVINGILIEP